MKKKLLVLTMSTLFATQLINSNSCKASVTESVDKKFVVPESGINRIYSQLTMIQEFAKSKC